MFALMIVFVVLAVLVIVLCAMKWIKNLTRFRLSVEGGWKQIKLTIEVDGQDGPKELW